MKTRSANVMKRLVILIGVLALPLFAGATSTIDTTNQYGGAQTSAGLIGGQILMGPILKALSWANLSVPVTFTLPTWAGSTSARFTPRSTTFSI